ncbi:ABC transporter substrate-binding protein [Sorangium sp. So ce394]|uniref:ABC transporter substrate-binding protein n=1 Tax=Sorangium sp. So ce394 TaxID=3133310 RepID=UPI003F5BAB22
MGELTRAGEERGRASFGQRAGLLSRVALRVGVLFVAFPLVVAGAAYHQARQEEAAALARHGDAIADLLNYSARALLEQGAPHAMQRVLANCALVTSVRRVRLTDLSGNILASSYRPEVGTSSASPLLRSFLDEGASRPMVQLLDERSELTIVRPMYHSPAGGITAQHVVGAIELVMQRRDVDAIATAAALRMLAIAGAASLGLFAAVLLVLRATLARRASALLAPARSRGGDSLRRLACLALLALLAAACSEPAPAPLRVGLLVWVGYSPLYIAAEHKMNAPVEAEIITFSTGVDMERAFIDGKLDIVASTLFGALRLADQGIDLQTVMALDTSDGADGIVARDGIASMRDLKGKRVAADLATISHLVLIRALDRSGMSTSDVEIVNLTLEQTTDALRTGNVDAAVSWEPFLSQAVADGAKKIFSSAELPNEITDVLLMTREATARRGRDTVAFLRGWDRALEFWRARPTEALGLMARAQGMKVDEFESSMTGLSLLDLARNRQLFDRSAGGPSLWAAYDATAQAMNKARMLENTPAPAEARLNPGLVAAALQK